MVSKENHPTTEKAAEKATPCEVTFVVGDKVFSGTSVHFSEGGMLVSCQQPAQLYCKLKLALKFPGFKNPLKINGEVVWTNIHGPADSLSPRGMGVKFLNLDRDTERLLGDLARSYESYGSNYNCYFT
jgi:Tfp pilus assembly protein PilZ